MAFSLAVTRAQLDNDAIQIVINGTSYQGWENIDIDSDILNPADYFIVSGTIPKPKPTGAEVRAGAPPQPFDDFREGNHCDIYVGLDRQFAGVIDDVNMHGDRASSRMKIAGRDLGAYLIDSQAKPLKAKQYTIKTLAEALIDPAWGIRSVIVSNEDNRRAGFGKKDKDKPNAKAPRSRNVLARSTTKIDPSERVASVLDDHTRRLGITWWLTAGGDLFIGAPNYDQEVAYQFFLYAEGNKDARKNNIENWSVTRASADRFSDITVGGQGFKDGEEVWDTSKASPLIFATARDPDLVERGIVRKLFIPDGDIQTKDECQKRVDHEMGIRRLKGVSIQLTVAEFRQDDRLFTVDTLASLKIEEAGIDDTFYITQRRFIEDRGKRRTELTLHQRGVWLT